MGFSCGCDDGVSDLPSFYDQKTVTARKAHICEECGHEIGHGEAYQRCTGCWDHRVVTYCRCERCADLSAAFFDVGYCSAFGDLFESYGDWLAEQPPDPRLLDDDGEPMSGWDRADMIRERHRNWSPAAAGQ